MPVRATSAVALHKLYKANELTVSIVPFSLSLFAPPLRSSPPPIKYS